MALPFWQQLSAQHARLAPRGVRCRRSRLQLRASLCARLRLLRLAGLLERRQVRRALPRRRMATLTSCNPACAQRGKPDANVRRSGCVQRNRPLPEQRARQTFIHHNMHLCLRAMMPPCRMRPAYALRLRGPLRQCPPWHPRLPFPPLRMWYRGTVNHRQRQPWQSRLHHRLCRRGASRRASQSTLASRCVLHPVVSLLRGPRQGVPSGLTSGAARAVAVVIRALTSTFGCPRNLHVNWYPCPCPSPHKLAPNFCGLLTQSILRPAVAAASFSSLPRSWTIEPQYGAARVYPHQGIKGNVSMSAPHGFSGMLVFSSTMSPLTGLPSAL